MDIKATLTALWAAIARQDADAMRAYFTPQAVICWHNTDEQFTLEEYLRANCEYPGSWRGRLERAELLEGGAVSAARVWAADGSAALHAVSFYRFENGRIARMDEYWGDDGAAPAWRQALGLGRPIAPENDGKGNRQ
ncbi:nuclear transport factor 2 family protein [Allofournierella sp.]|uniref:nuclear transport factor 2 family protein n=1 Tax=Allofournierella sp. TaxID=1940256 RepID=UPI003AF151BB